MFELSQMAIYSPIFMFQLLISEFLFAWNLEHRSKLGWRIVLSSILCILTAAFFPIVSYSAVYSSFMYISLFAATLIALRFCFRGTMKDIIFCAIAGYTVQHISQELYELVNSIFNISDYVKFTFYGSDSAKNELLIENFFAVMVFFFLYFLAYGLIYLVAYFMFSKQIKRFDIFNLNRMTMITLSTLIIFVDIIFSSIVTFSIPVEEHRSAVILLHIYNVACCVLVLLLLFELPKRKQLEAELMISKSLQEKERQQYEFSKENIERINMKCHDIKHQIHEMREQGNIDAEFLCELEKAVDIYDSAYKTNNPALNVILSEKSLICQNNGIELSCVLDGEALDFIKDHHIYSLFGNLLDNALEAVTALQKEERSIGLMIKSGNGAVLINVYNVYKGDIEFRNGMPITTKNNNTTHGYGLRSISNIVRYYDGEMNISTKDGVFEISIAIPMPN